MRTTLRAQVEVHEVVVLAELAVLERRPELQLLCTAARKQGALTPQAILDTLPGLSPAAGHTLRRHCQYLALCDAQDRLTPDGQRCAETGEVPIPELGLYRLWVARHPCFGERPLHFRRERTERYDQDYAALRPVPPWLRAEAHRGWSSVIDPELRFSLRAFPSAPKESAKCRLFQAAACELTWELDFDSGKNTWTLKGALKWQEQEQGRSVSFTTPRTEVPGVSPLETFAGWEHRWDSRRTRAAIDFDGQERGASGQPFLRNLKYTRVQVPNRGEYTQVEVLDVPVGPSSPAEAQRWSDALLCARIGEETGYVPAERLQQLFTATVQGSPLQEFQVRLPQQESLVKHLLATGRSRAAWMLAAPLDLRPAGAMMAQGLEASPGTRGAA